MSQIWWAGHRLQIPVLLECSWSTFTPPPCSYLRQKDSTLIRWLPWTSCACLYSLLLGRHQTQQQLVTGALWPSFLNLCIILCLPQGALTASWAGTTSHSVPCQYGRLRFLPRGIGMLASILSECFPSDYPLGLFSLSLFHLRIVYSKAEISDPVLRIGQIGCES